MPSSTRPTIQAKEPATAPPSPHVPAHQYSYRVPSPPRVVVPPPTQANAYTAPDLKHGIYLDSRLNGFANSEFLKTVAYGDFMNQESMLNWQYEQRRTAQKVLPFLFLGPYSAAKDLDFLRREGITMVMAVRDTMSAQANLLSSKMAIKAGIAACHIDVAGNQELIAAFPKAIEAINAHLSTIHEDHRSTNVTPDAQSQTPMHPVPGKVLVFCESGNERSAGVVTAYLMAMFSMALVPALQVVQTQRFCVSFDDSMRFLLQSYESILQAKRDVLRSASMVSAPTSNGQQMDTTSDEGAAVWVSRSSKRTLDEFYAVDMEMEDDGDERDHGRFEKREGFAPFEEAKDS